MFGKNNPQASDLGAIMTSSLQKGISAAKAGRMQEALTFLKDAIIEEPQNAEVWVWIAAIIDDVDKQAIFLEKALAIDPQNIPAQRGLAYLEKRKRDEAHIQQDHLSDHTRPISPFPAASKRSGGEPPEGWTRMTDQDMKELADPEGQQKPITTEEEPEQSTKLTAFETGLLGVVALVFCFIGLLVASTLFGFDLPLSFLRGARPLLSSEPPYPGVFLYEDDIFFDMQMHQGLPTLDQGIPTSYQSRPVIVFYQAPVNRSDIKLIFETGVYLPIRGDRGKTDTHLVQPGPDLLPGFYCLQQLNETGSIADAFHWCFTVNLTSLEE